MRLYLTADGQWAGTQRDARELAGKDWTEVDVRTDKWGLIDLLNKQRAPIEVPAPPSLQPSTDPVREQQRHDIAVEEEIGRADLPAAIRLFDHITWRIAELVKPARSQ